jgi:hypothetical protein
MRSSEPGSTPDLAIQFGPTPTSRLHLLPGAFGRAISRAVLIGVVVSVPATSVVSFLVPLDSRLGVPVWLVYPLLFAALGTLVIPVAMHPGIRAAFATFSWLGSWEVARFRSLTGSSVPTSEEAVSRWLAEHPQPGFGGFARIEMLALVGEFERARRELEGIGAPSDPADATERIGLAAWLDQMETGRFDGDPVRTAIADLPAGPGRLRAEVALGLLEARQGLGDARPDWWQPLAALRPMLGLEPIWIVARDTLTRLFVVEFLAAIVVGAAMLLITTLLF